jgi:hypothetical protein
MTFQQTVLIIATIILLVVLAIVGISLYKTTGSGDFPPVIGDCPDYWIAQNDGKNNICSNIKNLGKSSCPKTMNFNNPPWSGSNGLCVKSRWARGCDLTWDGVTNNADACHKKSD